MEEVMTELRKANVRGGGRPDYAADDELEGDGPRRRFRKPKARCAGIRRRPAAQNALSVGFLTFALLAFALPPQRRIRKHMKTMIHKDDWLKDVIDEQELHNWNPEIQECCTAEDFKLHLKGTPCSPWNSSATRVFAGHFLQNHSEIYPDVWAVRRMVLKKTQAYIKSLIRAYRQSNRGGVLQLADKQAKNRRERKSTVSPSKFFGIVIL
jgi:hypothetical protein